jgi:nitrate reductase gamma subunit
MTLRLLSGIIAGLALVFSLVIFTWRLRIFNQLARPADRARPKGNLKAGVLYAYTLGMTPWAKESTRLHMLAYLRGVAFHLGIFLGMGLLLASPWIHLLPSILRNLLALGAGLGAVFGLIGFVLRFTEPNLKAVSTKDDLFAVLLVSLFLVAASLWLVVPGALPVFNLVSAGMLIYAPFSKVRHCIYFAYSRLFYGKFVGSHAVLPHSQQVIR